MPQTCSRSALSRSSKNLVNRGSGAFRDHEVDRQPHTGCPREIVEAGTQASIWRDASRFQCVQDFHMQTTSTAPLSGRRLRDGISAGRGSCAKRWRRPYRASERHSGPGVSISTACSANHHSQWRGPSTPVHPPSEAGFEWKCLSAPNGEAASSCLRRINRRTAYQGSSNR